MKLYHATYKQFLKSIQQNGLGNTENKMWNDSQQGVVYLADDPFVAESYAEESEWAYEQENPDEYLDNIIILEIDVNKLDRSKLFIDDNVLLDEDEENATWEYHGIIPWSACKIFKELQETMNYITESKADTQKLIDFAGEELANRFLNIKDKFKSPENDLYYWIKNGDVDELEQAVTEKENTKSNTQIAKDAKSGAKLVAENDYWNVYHITTFEASQYYGRDTKWCITGVDGYGADYWYDYTEDGVSFYFFIKKGVIDPEGKLDKIALASYGPREFEIYNQKDDQIYFIPKATGISIPGLHIEKITKGKTVGRYEDLTAITIDDPSLNEFTFPKDTKYIEAKAFNDTDIKTVKLPDGVKSIGARAFQMCTNLTTINFPDSLESVYDAAFYATRLADVTLGENLKYLAPKAFYNCDQLTRLEIKAGVDIPENLCYYSDNLNEVILSEGTKSIGAWAFNVEGPLTITIPDSVTHIEKNSFRNVSDMDYLFSLFNEEEEPLLPVTFRCSKNSYAYEFAKQHRIKVELIESTVKDNLNKLHEEFKLYENLWK